jgi:hypothetical protein
MLFNDYLAAGFFNSYESFDNLFIVNDFWVYNWLVGTIYFIFSKTYFIVNLISDKFSLSNNIVFFKFYYKFPIKIS